MFLVGLVILLLKKSSGGGEDTEPTPALWGWGHHTEQLQQQGQDRTTLQSRGHLELTIRTEDWKLEKGPLLLRVGGKTDRDMTLSGVTPFERGIRKSPASCDDSGNRSDLLD